MGGNKRKQTGLSPGKAKYQQKRKRNDESGVNRNSRSRSRSNERNPLPSTSGTENKCSKRCPITRNMLKMSNQTKNPFNCNDYENVENFVGLSTSERDDSNHVAEEMDPNDENFDLVRVTVSNAENGEYNTDGEYDTDDTDTGIPESAKELMVT